MFDWKSKTRKIYERFVKIRGEPREIARGLAVGILIGFLPILGFQTLSALLLAALLKGNKIAAALGTLVSNPVTTAPIFALTYLTGGKLLGFLSHLPPPAPVETKTFLDLVQKAPRILGVMTLGGFLLGIPAALAGYFLCHAALKRYQAEIRQKLGEQRQKLGQKKESLARRSRQIKSGLNERRLRRKKQKSRKKRPRGAS